MTVWTERDLPMLRGLAETEDENIKAGFLSIGSDDQLGLGLDPAEAIDSLLTLRDAGFVQFREQHESGGAPNLMVTGFSVTGAGLQVLGEWPIFEAVSSPAVLAEVLERLAPEATSTDETSAAQSAAAYIRGLAPGVLRGLLTGAISTVLRSHGVPL